MRDLINLVEAAVYGSQCYWYNPKTGEEIDVGGDEHGRAVMSRPDAFGIEPHIAWQMAEAFPRGDNPDYDGLGNDENPEDPEEGDLPEELGGGKAGSFWDCTDAWEVLAMNRGWVRVGEAGYGMASSYLSCATPELAWSAVRYIEKKGGNLGNNVEIELCDPRHPDRSSTLSSLKGDTIFEFLKRGPKAAHRFLRQGGP